MVLDQAVGLQHIGTDVRSEVNVELGVLNLLGDGALLLHIELVELGTQHTHGTLFIFVLRALVLAAGDQAGGNVGYAHGGISGVHVLPAFSAGAVSIYAQVVGLDDNFDGFVNFRRHKHAGERSMPPLGLIERRNTNQTMYAYLAGQQAECVFSIDAERRRLDACLFAGLIVVEHRLKFLALGPAHVHAHQHLSPVLGFSSAGSRMNCHDGIAGIIVAGKQRLSFQAIYELAQRVNFAAQVGFDVLAFARKVKVGGDVTGASDQIFFSREQMLQALFLAHDLLGFSRIRPQIGVGGLLVYFGEMLSGSAGVKGNPGVR